MCKKSKFIVVEGPIGVGKTTLARKLANNLSSNLLLEKFSDNPQLLKQFDQMKNMIKKISKKGMNRFPLT